MGTNHSPWSRSTHAVALGIASLDKSRSIDSRDLNGKIRRPMRSPGELQAAGAGVPRLIGVEQQIIVGEQAAVSAHQVLQARAEHRLAATEVQLAGREAAAADRLI